MANRSGSIGTNAETAVVKYLRANGFEHAERRRLRGAEDWGDLTGTPGLCWEVKGGESARAALEAARGQDRALAGWLAETETERRNSRSDLGLLVVQRRGVTDAGRWFVVLDVDDLVTLVLASYGQPVDMDSGSTRIPDQPVRTELRYLVTWLREAGYGDPLPTTLGTVYDGPAEFVAALDAT